MTGNAITSSFLLIFILIHLSLAEINSPNYEILKKINEEIAELKSEINAYEQYEQSITSLIDKLELEIKLKEKEIKAYNIQIEILQRDIKNIENNINELEKRIKLSEDYIKRRIIVAYKMGSLGYYKMLFYPRNSSSILRAFQLINILSKKDQNLISDYQSQKQQLNLQQSELFKKQQ